MQSAKMNLTFNYFKVLFLSNGFGFLLSLRYDEIYWLPAFLLVLLTSGIIYLPSFLSFNYLSKVIVLTMTLAVPILYFSLFYSIFSFFLFTTIILLLSLKKHFIQFNMEKLYSGIESFIFLVVLNSFSFFSQTFFLDGSTALFLIGIYLIYLIATYLFLRRDYNDVIE